MTSSGANTGSARSAGPP
ncbi:hypothetical protein YPPY113_2922, partial [Yersinia pestis PY-113]